MYVKIASTSDVLRAVPDGSALHYGTYSIPWDRDAQDHDIVGDTGEAISTALFGEARDSDTAASYRRFFTECSVEAIEQHQTQYEANKTLLAVKVVWWYDSQDGATRGVVTTRNIFILNDNGKTIDRV